MTGRYSRIVRWIAVPSLLIYLTNSCNLFTAQVDFNTQIKPLINKKCISCHGGVRAKGGFSLLFQKEALAPTQSGKPAILPGDPDNSPLMHRITHPDPEERMPYHHDPLSDEEIALFRNWIKQGAKWGEHWAYVPVKETVVPERDETWIRNPIDAFILDRMEMQELDPSPEADKETLLRRLSLDIIGMPAPDSIAGDFLKDKKESSYEALVDRLLKSDLYGEKWASMWLDIARYADTRGYEADRARQIWKYRDWVIDAFNRDLPYDAFIQMQFAGDLFPDPKDEHYIATAFHRNSMTNDEGGSDNEEFRTAAAMDRVNTTWTGVLGTTFNCVQCHSHPYDPFTHEEYFRFLSYFNNSRDEDTEAEYPLLRSYDSADRQSLQQLRQWITEKGDAARANEVVTFLRTWQPAVNSLLCDDFRNAALVSSWYAGLRKNGTCRLPAAPLENKTELMFRYLTNRKGGRWEIYLDTLSGKPWKRIDLGNTKGKWTIDRVAIPAVEGKRNLYFRYNNATLKDPNETGVLFEWFRFADPFPGKGRQGYEAAVKQFDGLLNAKVTTTPILMDNPASLRRTTHVFERGNWMVKGKEVSSGVPNIFGYTFTVNNPERLQLAEWLASPKNPLTARVIVNRIWEQLYGKGIVETLEDFGTQGIPPTHTELLDWLAWAFMHEDKWSIKKLVKRMVMSATYRQSSVYDPAKAKVDPDNKWYARGPSYRLSAEQIRDQALFISGVLSTRKYGPGIMPYQPDGVWSSPYNGDVWKQSAGEDQYRRAVYIYWKRSAAYPSAMLFDGTGRQVCVARRIRTNTPLQALTLMNDPAYLDLARHFAFRMKKEGGKLPEKQIQLGYRLATGHAAGTQNLRTLLDLYRTSLTVFRKDADRTCEMVGETGAHTSPETAALIVVANSLLNLDEVIMKK